MTKHQIRCYDYVNQPYESVRKTLSEDAKAVFHSATKAAASRAKSVAAELHVEVAGLDIGTDITISVTNIEHTKDSVLSRSSSTLNLEWQAASNPHLFPLMKAELSIYPLTATETQLELFGQYQPPLGKLGSVIDAFVGRRIADVSVHRFVADIAQYLIYNPTTKHSLEAAQ